MINTVIIFLIIAMVLSVIQRVRDKKRAEKHELPEHAKKSPVSEALQELIATAGGIYLSLVLLISFLQIDLAEEWFFLDVGMDPLAFISLVISVIQPMFTRLFHVTKGGA
ncbi:MAG: hypothetical protein KGZ63_08205 [Clostridiales bacterium]|jgi:hypothetical protein|nr:hypothetical protein [Clostridiales bacterium]